jgi:hypothetical protein
MAIRASVFIAAAAMAASVMATAAMAREPQFGPVICEQFLAQYCVIGKDRVRQTRWTNPCFARGDGLRILHRGECGRRRWSPAGSGMSKR